MSQPLRSMRSLGALQSVRTRGGMLMSVRTPTYLTVTPLPLRRLGHGSSANFSRVTEHGLVGRRKAARGQMAEVAYAFVGTVTEASLTCVQSNHRSANGCTHGTCQAQKAAPE